MDNRIPLSCGCASSAPGAAMLRTRPTEFDMPFAKSQPMGAYEPASVRSARRLSALPSVLLPEDQTEWAVS
jgi:hypothetical protein